MTTTVNVGLGARSYDILIGTGLIDQADSCISPFLAGRRPIIITDDQVATTQLPRLERALGADCQTLILPSGEATKSWQQLERLTDGLLDLGVERGDKLIALGGGVIGDLVGFAASILKRGCGFIQVPTTLLAMVDSSVGGKTAINVRAGKNLIGSFHQPSLVVIDPSVLATLPDRQMRSGYAEIVKYGLINDAAFFEWCEHHAAQLLARNSDALATAIAHSVRTKAEIVAADERETKDQRALLNLGHTFGHALEADTGFSEALLHGEAVAAGMALAYGFSAATGRCGAEDARRVMQHLDTIGLPASLAAAHVTGDGAALVAHMLHDKKMTAGTLPFILAHGIGQSYVDRTVNLADVAQFLDASRG
ncbi:MAG: 3-dehydroquinate synthase [Sphingomonadaceae bacterium]|jgi:3-dehydroquinate synthase|nr:3-dehydroquinate synthase [Sphingomonadaceae bacterium]NBU79322.1 3-dehydroquinate synthase [Sphingomonadaceae bacterium]NCA02415.1 3-dehydroquinate synthase [Sphingomonadaceae bacterium]